MKKLAVLAAIFVMAFTMAVNAQKKVIVLNSHDQRYKNNPPRLFGHQDNGNQKNKGIGNTKWHKKMANTVVVPGRMVIHPHPAAGHDNGHGKGHH